jgi:subtilisin family serine protease
MWIVAALLVGCGVSPASALATQGDETGVLVTDELSDYENGEVFVVYWDGTFQVLTYEDDEALAAGLDELVQDETVSLIQPNYTYQNTGLTTSDTFIGQQWALDNDGSFHITGQKTAAAVGIDIDAQGAWERYDGGSRDVVIALIDTGVDNSHPDLQNQLWTNAKEIAGNGVDDDGNGFVDDVNGWNFYDNNNKIYVNSTDDIHGTHAAGTIAATADNGVGIAGIVRSDHVKIMVIKALGGPEGSGTTESIIKAINYAQANGASICNLSLGSYSNDRALYEVISKSSMLFVAAAGNEGTNTDQTPCYPAAYQLDNIISVANLSFDGTLHETSNYGATSVDLAAPGTYILSTAPSSKYCYMTGTSMATPMVTAAAAMLYTYYSDISLTQVRTALLSSVHKLDSLSGKTVTGGMLDLDAAMTAAAAFSAKSADQKTGSAPEIRVSMQSEPDKTDLIVTVTDPDGDLQQTAYAAGKLSTGQFQKGSAGQSFTLDPDGTATFAAVGSGVYTFYAVDSAGNETVYPISVTGVMPEHIP